MKCLRWRLPLPLKAINNKRSLVSVDNLLDFISVCVEHPAAAGQAFLVSDGEDLSTPQLLSRLGRAMGKPATLYSVPESIIVAGANLLGRPAIARRLCGSLQVDIDKSRRLLGWTPPYNVDDSLSKVVRDFL
ncbi:NAD-dependent dehydratase, partial [Metapseudomonas otitidis]